MKNIEKTMELMANGMTISKALAEVYKTRKIKIVLEDECLNTSIYKAKLNNRALHCFERLKIETLGQVVDYLNENDWNTIKNFGEGTAVDTLEKILDVAWSKLDTVERAEFLLRVDMHNEAKE